MATWSFKRIACLSTYLQSTYKWEILLPLKVFLRGSLWCKNHLGTPRRNHSSKIRIILVLLLNKSHFICESPGPYSVIFQECLSFFLWKMDICLFYYQCPSFIKQLCCATRFSSSFLTYFSMVKLYGLLHKHSGFKK